MAHLNQMKVTILETGILINKSYNKKIRLIRHSGFTLIEILIVMMILVITIGVVGLSVTSLQVRNELQPFINRFYQRLHFYGQDAVYMQSELGLSFFENKIEVLTYNVSSGNNVWQVKDVIRVPPKVKMQFKAIDPELFIRNVAELNGSTSIDIYNNTNSPEIIFTSGGQLSPFLLNISHPDEELGYTITGEFSGEISMEVISK